MPAGSPHSIKTRLPFPSPLIEERQLLFRHGQRIGDLLCAIGALVVDGRAGGVGDAVSAADRQTKGCGEKNDDGRIAGPHSEGNLCLERYENAISQSTKHGRPVAVNSGRWRAAFPWIL